MHVPVIEVHGIKAALSNRILEYSSLITYYYRPYVPVIRCTAHSEVLLSVVRIQFLGLLRLQVLCSCNHMHGA